MVLICALCGGIKRCPSCVRAAPTVMTHGSAVSPLYHFTLSDGSPLSAQTRCKFCCPPNPDVQPFIMGIHTIDRYCLLHTCPDGIKPLSVHTTVHIWVELRSFHQGTQHCKLSGKH